MKSTSYANKQSYGSDKFCHFGLNTRNKTEPNEFRFRLKNL